MTRTTVADAIKAALEPYAARGRIIEGARVLISPAAFAALGWQSMMTSHGRITIGVEDGLDDDAVMVARFGRKEPAR